MKQAMPGCEDWAEGLGTPKLEYLQEPISRDFDNRGIKSTGDLRFEFEVLVKQAAKHWNTNSVAFLTPNVWLG